MNVTIQTIPHEQQRYPTCGDWAYLSGDHLSIKVSSLGDWRMECCVAVHELVEALICKWSGITTEIVDQFDFSYKGDGEPGDDSESPYRDAHRIASGVEFTLALALGVSWKQYEDRIDAL